MRFAGSTLFPVGRLKSRKLWIAVFATAGLIAQGLYQEATAVIIAYLASQGWADGRAS